MPQTVVANMPQSSGSLQKKLKTALNETRLLVLGAQILLGFQLHGVFQESFRELSPLARSLDAIAIVLMVVTLGLLIAPSMQHRIVEEGRTTTRIFNVTGTMAGAALLPFAVSLGIDHYAVFERLFGQAAGYIAGAAFLALALLFWYGLEYLIGRVKEAPMSKLKPQEPTPISTKIEEMLTEARVVLPGAQALLGFQLAVTLTHAFEELPFFSKLVHAVALILVALAVILLMAPAAFHRIAFAGEDNEDFHRIGSWFIVAATVPLAGGIAGDVYGVIAKIAETYLVGAAAALVVLIVLMALWYVQPFWLRRKLTRRSAAARE